MSYMFQFVIVFLTVLVMFNVGYLWGLKNGEKYAEEKSIGVMNTGLSITRCNPCELTYSRICESPVDWILEDDAKDYLLDLASHEIAIQMAKNGLICREMMHDLDKVKLKFTAYVIPADEWRIANGCERFDVYENE